MPLVLLFVWWAPVFANAEMEITSLNVEAAVANDIIVTYEWRLEVSSIQDESMNCELGIRFFDESGTQILSRTEFVSISKGMNRLKGSGICKPDVWNRVKEYKAHLTCQ
jgi:hypothetical protein